MDVTFWRLKPIPALKGCGYLVFTKNVNTKLARAHWPPTWRVTWGPGCPLQSTVICNSRKRVPQNTQTKVNWILVHYLPCLKRSTVLQRGSKLSLTRSVLLHTFLLMTDGISCHKVDNSQSRSVISLWWLRTLPGPLMRSWSTFDKNSVVILCLYNIAGIK